MIVGAFPPAVADASPSATIVSPGNGATVLGQQAIRIHYAGYSPGAQNISGYLMLDGEPAGTFFKKIAAPPGNGTTFNATLAATGFASGAHVLSARVFTELDNPVDTPAVSVVLDLPPTIASLAYAYDLDTRRLHVSAEVTDDGGDSLVRLATGANNTTTTGSGALAFDLAARRSPGSYVATLRATDNAGQSTQTNFTFLVVDREADITILSAVYEVGGYVNIRANIADPDGDVWDVSAMSPLGSSSYSELVNGTWHLLLHVAPPQLGTFNGTLTSRDRNGGNTSAPFAFTIGGSRETFFDRGVFGGPYADATGFEIPRLLDGWIEICIDGCGTDPSPSGPSSALYDEACASWQSLACQQLTGRPGSGQIAPCTGQQPQNIPGLLLWTAFRTIETATGPPIPEPCTNAFDRLNETSQDDVFVSIRIAPAYHIGVAHTQVGLEPGSFCTSEDEPMNNTSGPTCRFETSGDSIVDVSWAQGPQHYVTVRVSGIRV